MKNKTKKTKEIKITSGIQAGFWTTFGAGLGDLQIVPSNNGNPPPVALTKPTVVV
jgi:hypothetical protein